MQDCLLGRSGKELAKSVYRAVEFANNQNELMLEAARDIERSKGKAMQQQMYTKMEELHNAYKKVDPHFTPPMCTSLINCSLVRKARHVLQRS